MLKADKLQELSELMNRSVAKMEDIRVRLGEQQLEFEEKESEAIEEQRKKLKYEKIRLKEETEAAEEEK
jgi:hypothetical protein